MASKRLSFLLISPLLTLAIGGWILTTALHQTIGTADSTKALLDKSGIYQAVIPAEVAQAEQSNPSLANYPVNNPDIQKALADSIGTNKIRTQGNKAVDDIYNWLQGKVPQPQFIIDVMPDRQALATSVGNLVFKRASSLPACTSPDQITDDIATHPFDATCLPPGVTPQIAQQLVEGEISTNPSLLTYAPLTSNDVTMPNGKPVFKQFASAPKWYQRAQWLPIICGALAIICILLILLIARPLRGIKIVGKHFLVVGITLAVCATFIAWGIDWLYKHYVPQTSNQALSNALVKLTSVFDTAYRDHIVRLSAYTAAAGLVLYVGALIALKVRRRTPAAASSKAKDETTVRVPTGESLAAAPRTSTFTPAGPPALPDSPKAAAPARAKKTAAKSGTKKKAGPQKTTKKKK